jgi:hypothetical protein
MDPVALFDPSIGSVGVDMRETVRTLARRSDITLEAFGWRLVEMRTR